MSDESGYVEQRARVALAIGTFVVTFNQIDLLSHKALEVVCDEPFLFRVATTKWQFEQRRALVVELLEWKRVAAPELLDAWKKEWGNAQAMADQRAHIAHGHMSMLGSANAPDEERFGVASLKKAGKPDFNMTLANVEALVPAVSQLGARITALINQVANCPWRDELVPLSRPQAFQFTPIRWG
jgi:hypothetical protein